MDQRDDHISERARALGRLLSAGERLDAVVPVRLPRVQRDQLAQVAREMGLSLSGYIRRVILAQPLPPRRPPQPIPEINLETYVELGHLGANINQLARAVNAGSMPGRAQLMEVLELVARSLGEIRSEVIGARPSREVEEGA